MPFTPTPRTTNRALLSSVLLVAFLSGCTAPQTRASLPALPSTAPEVASGYRAGLTTVQAERHMVAAANPLATEAGRLILRRGGSAIDAAVAVQAMLTLVEPQASGVGGGAFILYFDGKKVQSFDGRETAPAGAGENLFLKADGKPMTFSEGQIGGRSVGVPGTLRVLELAHRQHGKLPWAQLFQPAIDMAERGFPMSPRLFAQVSADRFISDSPQMSAYFLGSDGKAKPVGTVLKNPALATTLRIVARDGADALYTGPIAADIVAAVNGSANPGSMTLGDLAGYRAKEREPICADYRKFRVCGMPPPSSGGIAIAQMLGTLEALQARNPRYTLANLPPVVAPTPAGLEPVPDAVHALSEVGRQAYADRGLYLADSDFIPVNIKGLLDTSYLSQRASLIGDSSTGKALPGVPPGTTIALAPDQSPPRVSTSQIVAVDSSGAAISMTTTIESYFGSHLMVRGFMLNNELTDFSFVPNEGGKPVANRVQPGKRPRSSMAPTLVFDREADGQLHAALGSPGGSQIIEYVSKTLIGLLDWKMDVQSAINMPNFGSRNGPTELEKGLATPALVQSLKGRGHDVVEMEMTSGTQAIVRRTMPNGRTVWAAGADPRREGVALAD